MIKKSDKSQGAATRRPSGKRAKKGKSTKKAPAVSKNSPASWRLAQLFSSIPPRWRNAGILILIVLVCTAIFAAFQVDRRVRKRIHALSSSTVPAIYSAPLDLIGVTNRALDSGSNSKEVVLSHLARRRYLDTGAASPSQPGEYAVQGENLVLITRAFRTSPHHEFPPRAATISLASGKLRDGGDAQHSPLFIEPEIVSVIGSSDVRASTYTPLAKIPKSLQQAVLAIEDERFYSHFGLDLIGLSRAIATNIAALRLVQGGSTLTQQLAKNLILSPRRTFTRKLLEVPAAISLETHLSKDQILELYLNEIYLGQEGSVAIHGTPEASLTFFGKRVEQLNLAESATLAGMIKAPSLLSPRRYAKKAKERRNLVLHKMRELGMITEEELTAALAIPLKTIQHPRHKRTAPYFVSAVEHELENSLDLQAARASGLSVYTGLELGMQQCAELALAKNLAKIEGAYPRLGKAQSKLQAALVAIEPYSGLIKAWVGGRDFSLSQFDRVIQSKRQIGSTVKPFLYLTALDGSLNSYKVATAASILEDKPMEISLRRKATWIPENYDHDFRGDVTLRYALENSLNMPAVYVAQRVGIPAVAATLERFKLGDVLPRVPSLSLGAVDSTLLSLTAAYGALANGGVYTQPRLFISALDEDNEQLATSQITERVVADENAVYVLTAILQGVLDRGTGKGARSAGFSRPAAGKTGTSNDTRDAWFVGFTPNLVVGVWLGMDDNSPLGLTGGGGASPIWGEFMKCASPYLSSATFIKPRGIVDAPIDIKTGQLFSPECPPEDLFKEVFVKGTEPPFACAEHSDSDTQEYRQAEERIPARLPDSDRNDEYPDDRTEPKRSPEKRRERSFWDSLFG